MKKCNRKQFVVGCVEHYGDVVVFREHSVYQVRGFTKDGKHVNVAFRTATAARRNARACARSAAACRRY